MKIFQQPAGKRKSRFLLIGDAAGLFDGTPLENSPEMIDDEMSESSKRTSEDLPVHYVVKDVDRLIQSSDCQTPFGEIQDGHC